MGLLPEMDNNKLRLQITFDTVFCDIQNKKRQQLHKIKSFFSTELDQVSTLISLLNHYKRKHPTGMTFHEIVKYLQWEGVYHLFSNKGYIASLINSLSMPGVQILEIHRLTANINVTSMGMEFFGEIQKK
jgi:hypothetical protein